MVPGTVAGVGTTESESDQVPSVIKYACQEQDLAPKFSSVQPYPKSTWYHLHVTGRSCFSIEQENTCEAGCGGAHL